jgi:soluble lytic murein transglycosylase-like protein
VQIHGLRRTFLGSTILLATFLCKSADAFQRVTLRNGFSYDCARYEPIDDSHIRLFLTAQAPGTQAQDFIDLSRQSIATIETLPDPPQPPAAPLTLAATANVPELITQAGAQHHIDADLLASVIRAESGFHANAVSRTGARGLMQLMPATASTLNVHNSFAPEDNIGGNDAFRPDQNIAGGSTYLDQLLDRYDPHNDTHGLALALAAYNAGPAAVDRYHGVPPFSETRAYVVRVMNEFKRRKLALEHGGTEHSHPQLPSPTASLAVASLGSR